jgi:hypothetical protein
MSKTNTANALIIAGVLSILDGGCAATTPTEVKGVQVLDSDHRSKVEYIVHQAKSNKSYGGHLSFNDGVYSDGFSLGEHTFGTKIDITLADMRVYFFTDDIILRDVRGDGVDEAVMMECNHNPESTFMTGCGISKRVSLNKAESSVAANRFENALLDIIVKKYGSGSVSAGLMSSYEKAKSDFLGFAYMSK